MKLKICLTIVIFSWFVLPSISAKDKPKKKKINEAGQFLPYYGYSIVAMIDPVWSEIARQIEQFIENSNNLRRNYSPIPAQTYHMSVYTIYSCGNTKIPAVQLWENMGGRISDRSWLPDLALENENNQATCTLEALLSKPLNIKYASLKITETVMSLGLELQKESLDRIKQARTILKRIYEHPNKSMEPIENNLHITLAYIYGKKKKTRFR